MSSIKLSRFKALYDGMNGTAKKVYDAVPMQEAWSVHKIIREMERKGSVVSAKGVNGCLGYMVSVGLIEKLRDNDFIRVPVKIATMAPDETPVAPPPTKEQIAMATTDDNKPLNPLDVLSRFAVRARDIAQRASDIEDECLQLADEIESTALNLTETLDKDSRELAKLRQLKALLAGLAD